MSDENSVHQPSGPGDLDLEQLATNELGDWPSLARSWMAEGYSSQALSDFAALSPAEAAVLADLMIDVLRSLGVRVDIDRNIAEHVFTLSGFEDRCRAALAKPGADLQRTLRNVHVSVLASDQFGTPPVSVQTVIGDYNSPGTEPLTATMPDNELIETSAQQIIDTLAEHIGVRWPLCIQHGNVMTPSPPQTAAAYAPPAADPSWWCQMHARPVARIGKLTTSLAVFETLWWSVERELPPLRS